VSNTDITLTNFNVVMNRWAGSDLPLPTIAGPTNTVAIKLNVPGQLIKASYLLKNTVSATISGHPATLHPGASTVLSWRSTGAVGCNASGAWSGAVGSGGARVVKVGPAGNYDFNLICQNASHSASTALRVLAQ
jgi:hypothetical protein